MGAHLQTIIEHLDIFCHAKQPLETGSVHACKLFCGSRTHNRPHLPIASR